MKTTQIPVVFMVLLVTSSPVAAQSADWEDWPTADRWSIGAGYFLPELDTTVIVTDENGNIGTGISFEKNLGLDDSEGTVLVNVDWRFFKRHSLSYRYFDLQRSATANSSVSIGVGDEVFDITGGDSFSDIYGMRRFLIFGFLQKIISRKF